MFLKHVELDRFYRESKYIFLPRLGLKGGGLKDLRLKLVTLDV